MSSTAGPSSTSLRQWISVDLRRMLCVDAAGASFLSCELAACRGFSDVTTTNVRHSGLTFGLIRSLAMVDIVPASLCQSGSLACRPSVHMPMVKHPWTVRSRTQDPFSSGTTMRSVQGRVNRQSRHRLGA
jgi:hypothetical protein